MFIDLTESETINIFLETEYHNTKSFINQCLEYDLSIYDTLKVLYDYLNKYDKEITDIRTTINDGLVSIVDKSIKEDYEKDFQFIELNESVYLMIE